MRLLDRALINPLVILLSILSVISAFTGDLRAATVMAVMVVLGVVLRFVQQDRADNAAAKLKAMISVNAMVVRDGEVREIPLAKLVPGDVVHLAVGDMIPADIRIISCKDLFLIQASLTGGSFPVEKVETQKLGQDLGLLELQDICFLGTSVERGTAIAVVVKTGFQTFLGFFCRSRSNSAMDSPSTPAAAGSLWACPGVKLASSFDVISVFRHLISGSLALVPLNLTCHGL